MIEIIKGDITRIKAEAIVNAANTSLLGGGGVDGAIHRAAGPGLLDECANLGGCAVGSAKITKGYDLPAKHVIHTVGPVWSGGARGEDELLAQCYRNCLSICRRHGLKDVAFPSISTGAYRFPIERACRIALNTVKACVEDGPRIPEKVIFVLFSDNDLEVYRRYYREIFG